MAWPGQELGVPHGTELVPEGLSGGRQLERVPYPSGQIAFRQRSIPYTGRRGLACTILERSARLLIVLDRSSRRSAARCKICEATIMEALNPIAGSGSSRIFDDLAGMPRALQAVAEVRSVRVVASSQGFAKSRRQATKVQITKITAHNTLDAATGSTNCTQPGAFLTAA